MSVSNPTIPRTRSISISFSLLHKPSYIHPYTFTYIHSLSVTHSLTQTSPLVMFITQNHTCSIHIQIARLALCAHLTNSHIYSHTLPHHSYSETLEFTCIQHTESYILSHIRSNTLIPSHTLLSWNNSVLQEMPSFPFSLRPTCSSSCLCVIGDPQLGSTSHYTSPPLFTEVNRSRRSFWHALCGLDLCPPTFQEGAHIQGL